ncbi:hypothetical protein DRP07_00150 [Archaeoglobales archaeon]|nr:MAG: hypothetical protein DRP07_00150 [Archaeoglobales archaeon]
MKCWYCNKEAMEDSLVCKDCNDELDRKTQKKFRNLRRLISLLNRPKTVEELAQEMKLVRNTVYKYLVQLEERGIVERKRALLYNWTDLWRVEGAYNGEDEKVKL